MVRALTLVASLALAGLLVAITVLVTTHADVRPPGGSSSEALPVLAASGRATAEARPGPAAAAPRLAVEEAMRELDLIKPPRSHAAEDFTLPTSDGGQFRLSAHRGKVVLINFWATWCPPCREEMPAMQRLYTRQKDRRFTMVAVALDSSPAPVAPYLRQSGLTFPVALDPRMDLAHSYGVRALPASFIVDPGGIVVAMALGPRAWDGPAARVLVEGVAR